MDSQTKTKTVNLEDLQISIQDVHNKSFGNIGTCATAAATAEKTVTLGTTFSLVAGANVLLKFTNGISCENATLAVTHTTLDGTTVTESAKPIYYRGSALFAGLVAAGDMLLLRYNGTQFDVVGVLDKSSTMYTKTEVDELIADFITASVNNLVNYYLKSDTYSASQIDQMLAAISQFRYETVSTLPTASAQTMCKIYLVPATSTKTRNVKDEFITIETTETVDNEEVTTYAWEQIGSTTVDLSNYYTKTQTDSEITSALNTALAYYTTTSALNTLLAGKQDTIDSSHKLSADLIEDGQTNKVINVKPDWNASSGTAAEILNKPTIPAAQIQSDWNQSDDTQKDFIKNKPTIPTVPTISTDISADASSDVKTASPKAVKTYVDTNAPTVMGASGSGHASGLVPDPGATEGTTKYLREDGTWQVPDGGSTIPNNIALLENTDSTAYSPDFDAENDTVHVTAQSLTTAKKTQARTNIGAADASTAVNSTVIRNIVTISQADYDNLSSKDNNTLYIIV